MGERSWTTGHAFDDVPQLPEQREVEGLHKEGSRLQREDTSYSWFLKEHNGTQFAPRYIRLRKRSLVNRALNTREYLVDKSGMRSIPGDQKKEHPMSMVVEKKSLSCTDLAAQTALELPDREMMALVNVVITNLLTGADILNIDVKNNNIAVQVCAVVVALGTALGTPFSCEIAGEQ
jgi:hypothetical protein